MVNDLRNTHHQKSTSTLKTSKSLNNCPDKSTNLINNHFGITFPPPFYTKRPNKLHMARFKLFPKRRPFLQSKTNHRTSPLRVSQEQHPTLLNYSTTSTTQQDNLTTPIDNLLNNTLVIPVTDTFHQSIFKNILSFSSSIFSVEHSTTSEINKPSLFLLKKNRSSKIELFSTLEITVHKPDTPSLRLRILVPAPQNVNEATR